MSDKLNLVVNFMGIDKLSGSMKNIMMSSKASARELKAMKDEARSLERELGKVRKELSAGIAGGSGNLTELVQKERELTRAVAATNNQLQERGQRMARIQSIERRANKVAGGAALAGGALTVGVTAPLMNFGQQSIQAFQESQDAIGQVNASLASMGRQGEFTSAQLALMAQGQMKKSLYDDDQILRDVTSTMLTFGNVQGPMFARAQAAAVDLSVKFKKDLGGSAVMVGKALQDPIKGVTALSRVGVSFSGAQKEMIKSMVEAGDKAGAQRLIMAELEKQVAGSAEAARKANPGAAAKQAYDELQENVGGKLLPLQMKVWTMMGKVADAFNNASPAMQNFAVYVGIGAAVLGPLLLGISGIAAGVGMLAPLLAGISLPILAIGAAIGVAAYLIYANWGTIKAAFMGGVAYVQAQWQYLKSGVTGLMTFLQTLPARLAMIGRNMIMGLVNGLKAAGGMVWSTLKNIVMGGINGVKAFLGIKSPSRVFMALGGYVSEGMALGIDKGGRKAVSAAGRLATGVATAGALSMAPVAAAGGAQGASATPGSGGVHIQRVEIVISGDTGNPRGLAEQIMRELKQLQQIQARGAYDDGD
ncbi:MAG: hypothetical protein IT552_02500 [Sphingomonadaceae bacterium]|nr:hypothetical protein [Sphingomonadaceae bacterium]